MDFHNSDSSSTSSSAPTPAPALPRIPPFNLQQAVAKLQNHCSSFLQNLHRQQFFNPNRSSGKFNFELTISDVENEIKQQNSYISVAKNPVWARIASGRTGSGVGGGGGMSNEAIEERLAGIPVYALCNSSEEFVVVSGENSGKSLGLLCFNEEDAETLLEQMKSMDPRMRPGSKVVPVALNKVFQLKVDGVAFRLIPEPSQIENAIKARHKAGVSSHDFSGVPVFQSKSLVLRSQNRRYRPVFFKKEDLDNSLAKASSQQRRLNPTLREGDLQVAVFEDILHGMKDNSITNWDDVVFIPPGFDVSTDPSQQ